ncbi:MAG: basic secretory protein-like protein, partial [Vicinamibacteria bacterium]
MNPCPKCGFASEVTEPSCPRCGVVFAKIGDRRPTPPRKTAPPPPTQESPSSISLFNVIALSVILSGSGVLFWRSRQPDEEPKAKGAASVASEPGLGREIVVEDPQPPEAAPLILPGFQPPASAIVDAPAAPEIPDLPELSENTVNAALIERAKSIARDFPQETEIREYIAAAYLLLAGKEIRARRYNEALRVVDEAEKWSSDGGQIATFRAVIYGALESWELAEKWARTALAYGARGNEADLHHLLGKVHYYREEMGKAIEEFRKALSLKEDPEIRASLERAELEARTAAGFDQKRLSHFIVRYEGETTESTGRMVLDALERSHATLVSQLGFEPSEPVVVLLYSRRSYREMGGPHWSAGLFDGKIRVPVGGLSQVDDQIRGTLHHELVHAFIHSRAGESAPRWLHEGVAEYMEGARAAESGPLLARVLDDGASFEHCLPTAQCDVRIFYPAATSLVD